MSVFTRGLEIIGSKSKAVVAPLLLAALPLALACDTAEQNGQPGMQEQPPGQQPGQQAPGQQAPGQQPGQQAPGQQPGQQPAGEVSQEDIENFAEAYAALEEVQVDAQTRLQEAQSPEEERGIQQEAGTEIQSVLQEHDMTVPEYQQMVQRVNTDPQVRAQFEQALQEITG